jgi:hypothetical protein
MLASDPDAISKIRWQIAALTFLDLEKIYTDHESP